ncbi:unnamed protein product [Ilex paraguariensis]|uniref:Uncharacterized protein n=1 Tax=Ilex paraguariensis TaxID=185542 RepID=A0ABC8U8J9_9AQUA
MMCSVIIEEIDDENLNGLEDSQVIAISSTGNNKQPYLLEYHEVVATRVDTNATVGGDIEKEKAGVERDNATVS